MAGKNETTDCVFCKIAAGAIPAEFVYRDDEVFVIRDLSPQAPTHLLIIPVRHVESAAFADGPTWVTVMGRAEETARSLGLMGKGDRDGFRLVINTGAQSGQSVPHLHVHLLAGRAFDWPPG
ncbi:MAG: HIT domain-containing protein [Synergistaceae bacterium]|jgi:histidine triad (HIT) family protein|nr:HIT domain-containing protein [Synergistaceae bacterium]